MKSQTKYFPDLSKVGLEDFKNENRVLIQKKSNMHLIKQKKPKAYQGALGIDDIESWIQQVVIKTPLVIQY